MTPRVIPDLTDAGLRADCLRPVADPAADVEERRTCVQPGKHAHESLRIRTRPVVEAQGDVPPARSSAIDRCRLLDQPWHRWERYRKRRGNREDRAEHQETARTSAFGIAAISASVSTQKTAFGVPAAHQTEPNRRNDSSTIVRNGRSWPSGGTPPIE